MKLITYTGDNNLPAVGILNENIFWDAGKAAAAAGIPGLYTSLRRILGEEDGLDRLRDIAAWADAHSFPCCPLEEIALLAPIPDPEKILGAALNYHDFCLRGNLPVPEALKVFGKFPTAVAPPGARVDLQGRKVTYEGELGVIIGKTAKNIQDTNALSYVAGYTVVNDLTANDYVKEDVQLLRGKNLDGFLPMGPVLVTADELPNPDQLSLSTRVNGELRQDSNTNQLIFGVRQLIAYFASFLTLRPGDVIATGTPAGTALQFDPPKFLQPGDRVEISVEGIGTLWHTIA